MFDPPVVFIKSHDTIIDRMVFEDFNFNDETILNS